MHTHDLAEWRHDHAFDAGNAAGERGTRLVMWITAATMVVEIAAGWFYNSMALLADGWHMSSHALAIGLSAFAYAAARRHAQDPRYAFGTWKIEVLAGFSSALFLLGIAALMVVGSVQRLLAPEAIHYPQAMAVAVLGLAVNLLSARILGAAQYHGQRHGQGHVHVHGHGAGLDRHHHDLNLESAYVHVIADAATSLAAIGALAGGWWLGWSWLDPAMGIAGALVIALWAKGLLADTGKVLLDREMDHPVVGEIRRVVAERGAAGETLVTDLHVWRVAKGSYACALSLLTHDSQLTPVQVREWLAVRADIVHATIEIHRCPDG
jgi:cation diffusion facilitator family transporter